MHDPYALFQFKEHDIFLPMVVLEELDQGKKGLSDTARNVRQVNRFLDELVDDHDAQAIFNGLAIRFPGENPTARPSGKLFFQHESLPMLLPDTLPGHKPDNSILATALALQAKQPHQQVIVVSKDINLRIKAAVLGIQVEDYRTDRVVDDTTHVYSGLFSLPRNFWETHGQRMDAWQESGRTFYKVTGPNVSQWRANSGLYGEDEAGFEAIVRKVEGDCAFVEYAQDYRKQKNNVWGITARNREQNFALNVLLDPEIDFVTLVGPAGTGKTLLTLAAGLAQTLKQPQYREIIVTRVTVPVGEDIGFLPGTEEEKMTPWMGALVDNLEALQGEEGEHWDYEPAEVLSKHRIRVRSMNFMRGRTFINRFIIIDEAQNLTPKQMQTLVTRAGPGTKIVCLGNINQIDTPYLTETTSGLTYVISQLQHWAHSAHITLARGERSRLSDYAIEVL